jgi:hypothetical protein
MRIKLNFITSGVDNFPLPKIIFPINLDELNTIEELKSKITLYAKNKSGHQNLEVEELFIDNFLLPDEFEIGSVICNNDEIKYILS